VENVKLDLQLIVNHCIERVQVLTKKSCFFKSNLFWQKFCWIKI